MDRELRSKLEEIAADAARAEATRRIASEELGLIEQTKRELIGRAVDEFLASMLEIDNTQALLTLVYNRVKWATAHPTAFRTHLNKQKEG